jgi:hypothetical protein
MTKARWCGVSSKAALLQRLRFVCHSIRCFHEHHCLDADDNTGAPVFIEVSEEGSQLVDVGKAGV